jgi:hypothetical protein
MADVWNVLDELGELARLQAMQLFDHDQLLNASRIASGPSLGPVDDVRRDRYEAPPLALEAAPQDFDDNDDVHVDAYKRDITCSERNCTLRLNPNWGLCRDGHIQEHRLLCGACNMPTHADEDRCAFSKTGGCTGKKADYYRPSPQQKESLRQSMLAAHTTGFDNERRGTTDSTRTQPSDGATVRFQADHQASAGGERFNKHPNSAGRLGGKGKGQRESSDSRDNRLRQDNRSSRTGGRSPAPVFQAHASGAADHPSRS